MSRYNLVAKEPTHIITVGWDNPLQTYFLQVEDRTKEEDEAMVCWLGGVPDEITSIDELKEAIEPYGVLPEFVVQRLLQDHEERTQPSRLQKWAAQQLKEMK
jgi:hypothetical protein